MKSSDFNPDDSIRVIENALNQVKSEKTGAYYFYILWGAILFIHFGLFYVISTSTFLNVNFLMLIAILVFPLGGILSYIRSKTDSLKENLSTHFEKVFKFAFLGFSAAYVIVFISSMIQESSLYVALFPLLIGFTVLIVGGITSHKFSVIAGVISIILTGFSLNLEPENQYLIASIASLVACMIPGFFMRAENV